MCFQHQDEHDSRWHGTARAGRKKSPALGEPSLEHDDETGGAARTHPAGDGRLDDRLDVPALGRPLIQRALVVAGVHLVADEGRSDRAPRYSYNS